VEPRPVLLEEDGFEVLHKAFPVDLFLKDLPVTGVVVDLPYGGQPQEFFFAPVPKQFDPGLIRFLDHTVPGRDQDHVFGPLDDAPVLPLREPEVVFEPFSLGDVLEGLDPPNDNPAPIEQG
jgi:hypothetical protein